MERALKGVYEAAGRPSVARSHVRRNRDYGDKFPPLGSEPVKLLLRIFGRGLFYEALHFWREL